jgi:hypothetical protein
VGVSALHNPILLQFKEFDMAKLSGIENIQGSEKQGGKQVANDSQMLPGKVGKKKTGKPAKKRHAVLANKRVPRKRG